MNLRNLCLKIFEEVYDDGLFVNDALEAYFNLYDLEKNERAFMNRLVYGTLENQIKLDYIIGQFSTVPVKKIKKTVLYVLRMSLYQILFMDQVPDYSVCDEAVRMIKKRKMGSLSGFVNGVLRNIIRNPEKIIFPDETDILKYLSIRYSFPQWLVALLMEQYGRETTESVLSNSLSVPKICVRVQQPQDTEKVKAQLLEEGISAISGKYLPYALYLEGISSVGAMESFKEGKIQIQDESSMLVGAVAAPQLDQQILDLCAAPGGKTTHVATLLKGTGRVFSRDISDKKLERIQENCRRLGLKNVEVSKWDATILDEGLVGRMDIVLADVPCSGLGIIQKKPDIKYNVTPEGIAQLVLLQRTILETASKYVKPGGTLVYSTCTINRDENASQVDLFLKMHPEFAAAVLPRTLDLPVDEGTPYLQLLPTDDLTDGFFIAKLRRVL